MRLFYKEIVNKELQQFLLTDIEKIEVHPKFLYYWYKDKPNYMFRLNLYDITYVRIFD